MKGFIRPSSVILVEDVKARVEDHLVLLFDKRAVQEKTDLR